MAVYDLPLSVLYSIVLSTLEIAPSSLLQMFSLVAERLAGAEIGVALAIVTVAKSVSPIAL